MQRRLWSDFKVKFVFVTGEPDSERRSNFTFDAVNITLRRAPDHLTPTERLALLNLEADTYGDMLIGQFDDTYYNLTLKMMTTFRWVSAYCRSPVVLFIDDDYSIVPSNLIRLLRSTPAKLLPWLNLGTKGANGIVKRPITGSSRQNIYAISTDDYPWETYPSYSSGAAYLLGRRVITDVTIAMAFVQPIRFDDAFLGMTLSKLGFNVIKLSGMNHGADDKCAKAGNTITSHGKYVDACFDWQTGELMTRPSNVDDALLMTSRDSNPPSRAADDMQHFFAY